MGDVGQRLMRAASEVLSVSKWFGRGRPEQGEDFPASVVAVEDSPPVLPPRSIRGPRNGEIHVDIDLVDKCNLFCHTCWRGVGAQKNTSATMSLDKFTKIVGKIKDEGYPNIALINWSEPFLNKRLHEYVPIIGAAGIDCWLSSNLSLRPDTYLPTMISALAAGVDVLFVSVSGFSQEIYEINHKGGRVDWIKENLAALAEEHRAGRITTGLWLRYLEFPYNAHEVPLWAEFAEKCGIGLDIVPAHGDPNTPLPGAEIYQQHVRDRLQGSENNETVTTEVPQKICGLIADRLAIDPKGDVYLCCAYPNAEEVKIGAYVDVPEDELLLQRIDHPFCRTCLIPARDATDQDRERVARALESRQKQLVV